MRTIFFILLFFVGCQKEKSFTVLPPKSIHISSDFTYLVSLKGFMTANEAEVIHKFDPTIKYLLGSGHASQRASDKDSNYKNAEEFKDITNKDFKLIRKIEFGGSFLVVEETHPAKFRINVDQFFNLIKSQFFYNCLFPIKS